MRGFSGSNDHRKAEEMRMMFRLLAVAGAAVASLALASGALATPKLIVSGSTVQLQEQKSDAGPAKVQIYVPTGYTGTPSAPAGTKIGTAHADIQALAISEDAIVQADGDLVTDDPANHLTDACAPGMHTAIWVIKITVSGVAFTVPIYVDAPPPGAEAALGAVKLSVCFSNPYVKSSPSDLQPKVLNAILTINSNVLAAPASGEFHWTSLITPWSKTSPLPDAAHTVEARSIVRVPDAVSLKAKLKTIRHKKGKKTTVTNSVTLTGLVSENGQGVGGATVDIIAGGKKRGSTKTSSSGTFSRSLGVPNKVTFQAKATVPERDVTSTGCGAPVIAPGGCVSATMAGWTLSSSTVTVTPKKK
jgi:hypothetical protein